VTTGCARTNCPRREEVINDRRHMCWRVNRVERC
jgi:hypothetical protein